MQDIALNEHMLLNLKDSWHFLPLLMLIIGRKSDLFLLFWLIHFESFIRKKSVFFFLFLLFWLIHCESFIRKSPYSLTRLYWFVPFCTIITTVFCFGLILFSTMMKPFWFDLIPMIRILNPFYFSLILFCSKLCFDFIPMIRITKEFCFGLMPLIRMINPFYFGLSLFFYHNAVLTWSLWLEW